MFEWKEGLKLSSSELYLDSRVSRPACFISHAHQDHLAVHDLAIATAATLALAKYRVGIRSTIPIEYGPSVQFDDQTTVQLLPAGHVLGSAMLHVSNPEGTLLYTGDFKLRGNLTVPEASPCRADVLVMETTYGRPMFRFPPRTEIADQLVALTQNAIREGRQPIVMGYSLGKAQEITRILTAAGIPVTQHGAAFALSRIYEQFGVKLGPYRRYMREDFHGPRALELEERGVLVAPPRVTRTAFATRFENPCRIMMTGWGVLKNACYRYGADHVLPLSDHADFDELLELVDRVQPKKIFTHHGYAEFAQVLRDRGHDARTAKPDEQLSLFE